MFKILWLLSGTNNSVKEIVVPKVFAKKITILHGRWLWYTGSLLVEENKYNYWCSVRRGIFVSWMVFMSHLSIKIGHKSNVNMNNNNEIRNDSSSINNQWKKFFDLSFICEIIKWIISNNRFNDVVRVIVGEMSAQFFGIPLTSYKI